MKYIITFLTYMLVVSCQTQGSSEKESSNSVLNPSVVDTTDFNSLHWGMSMEEVKKILGKNNRITTLHNGSRPTIVLLYDSVKYLKTNCNYIGYEFTNGVLQGISLQLYLEDELNSITQYSRLSTAFSQAYSQTWSFRQDLKPLFQKNGCWLLLNSGKVDLSCDQLTEKAPKIEQVLETDLNSQESSANSSVILSYYNNRTNAYIEYRKHNFKDGRGWMQAFATFEPNKRVIGAIQKSNSDF